MDLSVSDLYLLEPEGRLRRLTDGTRNVLFASASADGRFVVFTTKEYDERDRRRLYLLDLRSGETRLLPTGGGEVYHPDISRDGRRVVYTVAGGDSPGIWLLDIASGRETRLRARGAFARFAPEGDRILFLRGGRLMLLPRLDPEAAAEPIALPAEGLRVLFPRWRPWGIVFVYERIGNDRQGIGLFDPATGRLSTFHEGPYRYTGADIRMAR